MANYDDPSVRYDNGLFYDDAQPAPERKIRMALIKLNLSNMNAPEVIQFGKNVHTGLTGNANVPTPNPTVAALQTLITAAENANDAYEAEKATLASKKSARDAAALALANGLRTEAYTVEVATGGDAAKIITTGFEVKSNGAPIGVPVQVTNLSVKASDMEGNLKANWKKVRGADAYEIQSSLDTPTTWVPKGSVTKTRAQVNSFTSGQRIWLRVRALGTAGEGPWSDAAAKIVP